MVDTTSTYEVTHSADCWRWHQQCAVERCRRAEAALLHFAAEAHRRKWRYQGKPHSGYTPPAFKELHRLGDEIRAALDALNGDRRDRG